MTRTELAPSQFRNFFMAISVCFALVGLANASRFRSPLAVLARWVRNGEHGPLRGRDFLQFVCGVSRRKAEATIGAVVIGRLIRVVDQNRLRRNGSNLELLSVPFHNVAFGEHWKTSVLHPLAGC